MPENNIALKYAQVLVEQQHHEQIIQRKYLNQETCIMMVLFNYLLHLHKNSVFISHMDCFCRQVCFIFFDHVASVKREALGGELQHGVDGRYDVRKRKRTQLIPLSDLLPALEFKQKSLR